MDVRELFRKSKEWLQQKLKKEPEPEEIPSPEEPIPEEEFFDSEENSLKLAEQFGLQVYKDLSLMRLTPSHYKKVPYTFVRKHLLLPIALEGETILVALSDPLNLEPLQELRFLLGASVKAVYASKEEILTAINECYNKESGTASEIIAGLSEQDRNGQGHGEVEIYDLLEDSYDTAPIIRLLNLILKEAIQQGASDVHFEPTEEELRVRYRIDGVLHTRHNPAPEYAQQLLTRIKVMAKLDIAERRLPQDGRIKLRMGRRQIDFRVSTLPIANGERIVLRILDKGNVVLGLDKLGMLPRVSQEFKRLIEQPEGIVLVTGPTGSGKTTTLYSAVTDMYNEAINIMTIEDPVEYNLKGIAQIGVKTNIGLTFAVGLRHILRQDPDVVMIGEIRDTETAEIAIQAALTGHLVLSTLHTNDAPSAITRLVDMGVEPYLLSSSIIGVQAQRLVRTICENCKEPYHPDADELRKVRLTKNDLIDGVLYRGKGCDKCFGYGYKGRHGVYELMRVSSAVQQQIVHSADAVAMRRVALEQGMSTLGDHGADLVKKGITTVSEVLRVIRNVED